MAFCTTKFDPELMAKAKRSLTRISIGLLAGLSLIVTANLLFWFPPEGALVSPWLAVGGTLAGVLVIAAAWAGRNN